MRGKEKVAEPPAPTPAWKPRSGRTEEQNAPVDEVFDRPTAIPELPPDEHARVLMQQLEARATESGPPSEVAEVLDLGDEMLLIEEDEPPSDEEEPIPLERVSRTDEALSGGRPSAPSHASAELSLSVPPETRQATAPLDFVEHQQTSAPGEGLPSASPEAKKVPPQPSSRTTDNQSLCDLYAVGDFSGALARATMILQEDPDDATAQHYRQRCEDVLTKMSVARLGSLTKVAKVVRPDEIRWLSVDHRAGFVLSLIDGRLTLEEVLDISGMPRLDALRILVELRERGVIEVAD